MCFLKIKSYTRDEDGAAAIEFALIAIPFFMIMLGIFETGRAMWTMNTVQYAVEDAGRYASINEGLAGSEIEEYAEDKLRSMAIAYTDMAVSSSTYSEYGIDWVEITVTYELEPLLGSFIPFETELFTFESSVKKPLHY